MIKKIYGLIKTCDFSISPNLGDDDELLFRLEIFGELERSEYFGKIFRQETVGLSIAPYVDADISSFDAKIWVYDDHLNFLIEGIRSTDVIQFTSEVFKAIENQFTSGNQRQ
ncbi:MAG: hypothetical protein ACO363_04915 [Balneolaceae bacterium]